MKLKYLKLFESFDIGDTSKIIYSFSKEEGYTTFYLEVFLKGIFRSTWCSSVKIVAQEIAADLNKEGWNFGVLSNTVFKKSSKKSAERDYKLCKTTLISELDAPISSEDKEKLCKIFAEEMLIRLGYIEPSDIRTPSYIKLDEIEKLCCKVSAGKEISYIASF
jgi:hypothetical protein